MKFDQKSLSVVKILIVVAVVGVIGLLFYNTQNKEDKQSKAETIKLSEYKNNDLGLSLSYPEKWGTPSLADGPLSMYQTGTYRQLSFSKATKVSVNFVTGPYSSTRDGCGYNDPVQNAQHDQNASQASIIGWDENNIKRYMTGAGFDGPTVSKISKIAGDDEISYTELSKSNKTLLYKDQNLGPLTAGSDNGCGPITQDQADQANAFENFFHFATNYSNDKVFGVNGQFDARKGDDTTARNRLSNALNSIK